MKEVFGASYVEAYDLLYQDKDYAVECDLIECLFQTYGGGDIRSVLDLGCGTGNHSIPLAERGYEVVGVDRSESMVTKARRKLAKRITNGRLSVQQGDIRNIHFRRHFDAVLMMFAVLGYQLEDADVLSALGNARAHLRAGGLLLFDVWYGPAVLHQRPSQRIKIIPTANEKVLRVASGDLDTERHVCTVHFHVWRFQGERLVGETEEIHPVRYFFPLELDFLLQNSGFASIRLGAFPKFNQDPDETTWNVMGVARAI